MKFEIAQKCFAPHFRVASTTIIEQLQLSRRNKAIYKSNLFRPVSYTVLASCVHDTTFVLALNRALPGA